MVPNKTEFLLKALLAREENSLQFIEELNGYIEDLKNGSLSDSDVGYIEALAKRLGVSGEPESDLSATNPMESISLQLQSLSEKLENMILKDEEGISNFGFPHGEVRITLEDSEGKPATFYTGNEKEIKSTLGYNIIKEECKRLNLILKFESDYYEMSEEQRQFLRDHDFAQVVLDFAPTIYHVDVSVRRWPKFTLDL